MKKLNVLSSFKVMQSFLASYYFKTYYDDLGVLLGGMQLTSDGRTFDAAFWEDWNIAVGAEKNLTMLQTYNTMQVFINMYAQRISSKDLKQLLESMKLDSQGKSKDPEMWEKWQDVFEKALKGEIEQLT